MVRCSGTGVGEGGCKGGKEGKGARGERKMGEQRKKEEKKY